MNILSSSCLLIILLIFVYGVSVQVDGETVTCSRPGPCFLRPLSCPSECPTTYPSDPQAKVCYVNCNSPVCRAACRSARTSFDSHAVSVEATKAMAWDDEVDHIKLSYERKELLIPEGYPSLWKSPENDLKIERTSSKNSVLITIPEVAEISVNVVPVTKEDDRIHNYQIPSDDCFAHLEVQFRFYGLSSKVEGVLGRTYQEDFKNPAKPGVAMPIVGGEDKYRITSLLSADCASCNFSPSGVLKQEDSPAMNYGTLDCTSGPNGGNGIVCRK
ncbi:hypothetical protein RJ639_047855 [Escallonia herrerae]|uniref:Uncharacterized protein n=1 Tax=Escallonia herrerae TaxID=1293975 RepID=A0AA88W656_9ASTE|nr:hypothetical protein RJ639_047855 [Escallonia herrerae]